MVSISFRTHGGRGIGAWFRRLLHVLQMSETRTPSATRRGAAWDSRRLPRITGHPVPGPSLDLLGHLFGRRWSTAQELLRTSGVLSDGYTRSAEALLRIAERPV